MRIQILTALLAAVSAGLPLASTQADTLLVDPVHSSILVGVKHLNTATAWGRFNDFSGTIVTTKGQESVVFTVKTTSVDTAVAKRDEHLRSTDFFNVDKHPEISFKSTKVVKKDDKSYEVTGDFTVLGVTKPVTATVTVTGSGKGMQGEERTGFSADFSVKRSDYGMSFMQGPLGDDVSIKLNIEAIKQP